MGRKGQGNPGANRRSSKKKEINFGFHNLRSKWTSEDKWKLINFMKDFTPVFKDWQSNLFTLTKKFDVWEMKLKNFQAQNSMGDNGFNMLNQENVREWYNKMNMVNKGDSNPEGLVWNENDILDLLDNKKESTEEKDEKGDTKKLEDYVDDFFAEEAENVKTKKEEWDIGEPIWKYTINNETNYSEKLFNYQSAWPVLDLKEIGEISNNYVSKNVKGNTAWINK